MTTVESPLPLLDSDYPVSPENADQFKRDGHILLRQVASCEEVEAYRPLIHDAVQRYNTEKRPLSERGTYEKAFLQVMNLWTVDKNVRMFSLARRFARIAADLLQVDAVRIYHDQALFKEPGGGPTPWHQDQIYWPLDTENTVTMWMPLVDCPIEMGALTYASGSHVEGCLCPYPISDESENFCHKLVAERNYRITVSPLEMGDATFHSGWTLHKAPANHFDRTREAMAIIYFADGARVVEPDHECRQQDIDRWLPDCKPGEPAAGVLNPVVYRR